jgi:hypothetical protein
MINPASAAGRRRQVLFLQIESAGKTGAITPDGPCLLIREIT